MRTNLWSSMGLTVLSLGAASIVSGCDGQIESHPSDAPASEPAPSTGATTNLDVASLDADTTLTYLNKIAPPLVGRVLTASEAEAVKNGGGKAIEDVVRGFTQDPAFVRAARTLVEQKLSVSGQKGDIDFDLPGNIVEHAVKNGLPWSTILTADTCYDRSDKPIACDSGAPYVAGVLTTRGYLKSRASRFNLTRASTLLRAFACRGYPQEDTLQPRIDRERLIPMFRAMNPSEQTEEKAKGGFGNGEACFTCHGQFSLHAQLFVKFDQDGLYQPTADGIQDPDGELGRSLNGLMASHLDDPDEAKNEKSSFFGEDVDDLAGAAKVLSKNPVFAECAVRNVLEYSLLIQNPDKNVNPLLLQSVANEAKAIDADPTFDDIVIATFTAPGVVEGVLANLDGTQVDPTDEAADETEQP